MPGTILRDQIADGHFVTMPDESERCIRLGINIMSAFSATFYARPSYDPLFSVAGNATLDGSDYAIVKEIGVDGGWWGNPTAPGQPSWAELEADGSLTYTSPRTGAVCPGIYGISAAFADWVIINTTRACEGATEHWLHSKFLPKVQAASDNVFASWVPDPPPTPVPPRHYDPTTKGLVQNALVLCDAQGTRAALSVDPNNPVRVLVGAILVPQ